MSFYYIFYKLLNLIHSFAMCFYKLILKVDAYTEYRTASSKSLSYIYKHPTSYSLNPSKT